MVLKKLPFTILITLLFSSCQDAPSSHTKAAEETPAQKGASLYSMHCAQCHGEDGRLGSSGAKDLSKSLLTDAEIRLMILNGKNAMPPMKALLETAENIDLVVSHVKRLRK